MYYKISPIIIAILIVIIIVIAGFGVKLLTDQKSPEPQLEPKNVSEIVPILELNSNTNEENQTNVTITAKAKTEDESGIASLTLPDGTITYSDTATYETDKNGSYTFKAKGNNGQISSLTIEVTNIREISSQTPYIPTGFSHVEGEVETGYVIEDKFGNQFVWIPVANAKLIRNTMLDNDYEDSGSALVNSVAQNYGFYMARYEASSYEINGEKVASSMADKTPWTHITYVDAANAASKAASVFEYEDCQTALVNSHAWDTALSWIDQTTQNYSTNTRYGNYSGEIRNTGTTSTDQKNNLCDLAGNVREWTTEIYKEKKKTTTNTSKNKNKNKNATNQETVAETVSYRVIRGGSANLNRTASSHTGYKENTENEYWGFRMILYK